MTWEYRVIRHIEEVPRGKNVVWLQIHRVYYHGDMISSWEPSPSCLGGESLKDLQKDLLLFSMALEKPILRAEEMPK